MILGLGIDLVEVSRISNSLTAFGTKFTHRVFTEAERNYCQHQANSVERFAARFAAKEAAMKALGTGWGQGVSWTQIEVVNDAAGKPALLLHDVARKVSQQLGVKTSWLTISHTALLATCVVVLEG